MRPKIGLFHRHPLASAECCLAMWKVLAEEFDVKLFGVEDCTYRRMRSLQIVAFPGGFGNADEWSKILSDKAGDVRRYVAAGGRYLGVCMGAYWAGEEYFGLVPGTQIERYIEADGADIRRSYMTTARVSWEGTLEQMFFWDGPVFAGDVGEVVATYANGGVMAMRRGRVGLIGCHPESQADWYTRRYMLKRWHGGRHGTLLQKFASRLLSEM